LETGARAAAGGEELTSATAGGATADGEEVATVDGFGAVRPQLRTTARSAQARSAKRGNRT
jgi:hypothetical protein